MQSTPMPTRPASATLAPPPIRVALRYEVRSRMWLFGCLRCGYVKATRDVDALRFPQCRCVCSPFATRTRRAAA